MTTTEAAPQTITTLRVDDLQPGDEIRLVGVCSVVSIERTAGLPDRRVVYVRTVTGRELGVFQWKYSRIEVLSDVNGRGHLVTPVKEPEAY